MTKRLTTTEAAEVLGVSGETIRAYIRLGFLTGQSVSGEVGRGKRMYLDGDEVEAFARGGKAGAEDYRDRNQSPKRKGRRPAHA